MLPVWVQLFAVAFCMVLFGLLGYGLWVANRRRKR